MRYGRRANSNKRYLQMALAMEQNIAYLAVKMESPYSFSIQFYLFFPFVLFVQIVGRCCYCDKL